MAYTKNALIELVRYETVTQMLSPFFNARKLHYEVIKITDVYHHGSTTMHKGEWVFETPGAPHRTHHPYFSDDSQGEGVWLTEGDNRQPIKYITLNQLFILLSDKMKIEATSNHLLNNFMNILGIVTCYREYVIASEEENEHR